MLHISQSFWYLLFCIELVVIKAPSLHHNLSSLSHYPTDSQKSEYNLGNHPSVSTQKQVIYNLCPSQIDAHLSSASTNNDLEQLLVLQSIPAPLCKIVPCMNMDVSIFDHTNNIYSMSYIYLYTKSAKHCNKILPKVKKIILK